MSARRHGLTNYLVRERQKRLEELKQYVRDVRRANREARRRQQQEQPR